MTYEERMTQLRETFVYKSLASGDFSFITTIERLKKEAHKRKPTLNIKDEVQVAVEIYYAVMFKKGFLDLRVRRNLHLYFRRDVLARLVEKAGLNPTEQTLKRFYRTAKICRLATIACTQFTFSKIPQELSEKEVVAALTEKTGREVK